MTRREAIDESEIQVYEILENLVPDTHIYDILTNLESYGLTYVVTNNVDVMSDGNIYFSIINNVVVVIVEKKEDNFTVHNHFRQYSEEKGETNALEYIKLNVVSPKRIIKEITL